MGTDLRKMGNSFMVAMLSNNWKTILHWETGRTHVCISWNSFDIKCDYQDFSYLAILLQDIHV